MKTIIALIIAMAVTYFNPALVLADGAEDAGEITIELARNMRLFIRPTLLGLVPPSDPTGYGEVFVRITAADYDSLSLHYEIKEAVITGEDEQTRIRRGEVEAKGLADGTSFIPPLFWPDGDWSTYSGLLWLSRSAFTLLTTDKFTPWEFGFGDVPISREVELVQAHIQQQADGSSEWQLELVTESARYPCRVNGERTSLAAIHARDSQGLLECWILDDVNNPLILKLNLLPPTISGLHSSAIEPGEALGLITAGAGYAVVDIDY